MTSEQSQRISHDHAEAPARRSTARKSPREEAEGKRKVWCGNGDDAKKRKADGGVEARPEVDELLSESAGQLPGERTRRERGSDRELH